LSNGADQHANEQNPELAGVFFLSGFQSGNHDGKYSITMKMESVMSKFSKLDPLSHDK